MYLLLPQNFLNGLLLVNSNKLYNIFFLENLFPTTSLNKWPEKISSLFNLLVTIFAKLMNNFSVEIN